MTTISIIGSHGIYANYGGFDQLVNNLVEKASPAYKYVVFNSVETPVLKNKIPKNCKVIRLPFSASGFQGMIYDFLSVFIAIFQSRKLLLLGAQGAPLAILFKYLSFGALKVFVNVGGVEWERKHLSILAKLYLKMCFYLSCYAAEEIILDNNYFLDFVPNSENINRKVNIIPYGGEIDCSIKTPDVTLLEKYNFLKDNYFLSISRSNPDNLLDEICGYFLKRPDINLVLISNLSNSSYGKDIQNKYKNVENIHLIDGLYFKPELDLIRRYSKAYIHTHTLSGSAPSLIEMVVAQRPIFSINTPQNKNTLNGSGYIFNKFSDLDIFTNKSEIDQYIPSTELANSFRWTTIVKRYENVYNK